MPATPRAPQRSRKRVTRSTLSSVSSSGYSMQSPMEWEQSPSLMTPWAEAGMEIGPVAPRGWTPMPQESATPSVHSPHTARVFIGLGNLDNLDVHLDTPVPVDSMDGPGLRYGSDSDSDSDSTRSSRTAQPYRGRDRTPSESGCSWDDSPFSYGSSQRSFHVRLPTLSDRDSQASGSVHDLDSNSSDPRALTPTPSPPGSEHSAGTVRPCAS